MVPAAGVADLGAALHDRRAFLSAAGAALALAPACARADAPRRAWRIGGRRVKTVDIHAHVAPDLSSVIGDTPFQARSQSNLQIPREIDAARFARMDSQGIDVQVLSVNPYWYEMDRALAQRFIDAQNAKLAEITQAYPNRLYAMATWPCSFPILPYRSWRMP